METPAPPRPAREWGGFLLAMALLTAVWAARTILGAWWVCGDDLVRVVHARAWLLDPTLGPPDAYWLPLPMWSIGILMAALGEANPIAQTLQGFIYMLLAGAVLSWPSARGDAPWGGWLAALWLTVPLNLELTTSALSEPPVLLSTAWALRALWGLDERLTVARLASLLGALAVGTLCRYESWLVAGGVWTVACLRIWRTRGAVSAVGAFAIGGAILSIFPAIWLHFNWRLSGDPLHAFRVGAEQGMRLSAGRRWQWATGALLAASLPATILGAIGVRELWRQKKWGGLAALAICSASFPVMVATNRIGSQFPLRFALPALLCLSIAGGVAIQASRVSPGWGTGATRRFVLLGMAWALFWAFAHRHGLAELELARRMRQLAPESGPAARIVFFDYLTEEFSQDLQIFRATLPRDAFVPGEALGKHCPLDDEFLARLGARWIVYRHPPGEGTVSADWHPLHRLDDRWTLGILAGAAANPG